MAPTTPYPPYHLTHPLCTPIIVMLLWCTSTPLVCPHLPSFTRTYTYTHTHTTPLCFDASLLHLSKQLFCILSHSTHFYSQFRHHCHFFYSYIIFWMVIFLFIFLFNYFWLSLINWSYSRDMFSRPVPFPRPYPVFSALHRRCRTRLLLWRRRPSSECCCKHIKPITLSPTPLVPITHTHLPSPFRCTLKYINRTLQLQHTDVFLTIFMLYC